MSFNLLKILFYRVCFSNKFEEFENNKKQSMPINTYYLKLEKNIYKKYLK